MKNSVNSQILVELLMVNDQKIKRLDRLETIPYQTVSVLKSWLTEKHLSSSDIDKIYRISYFDDVFDFYSFSFEGCNQSGILGSIFIKDDEIIGESSTPLALLP